MWRRWAQLRKCYALSCIALLFVRLSRITNTLCLLNAGPKAMGIHSCMTEHQMFDIISRSRKTTGQAHLTRLLTPRVRRIWTCAKCAPLKGSTCVRSAGEAAAMRLKSCSLSLSLSLSQ